MTKFVTKWLSRVKKNVLPWCSIIMTTLGTCLDLIGAVLLIYLCFYLAEFTEMSTESPFRVKIYFAQWSIILYWYFYYIFAPICQYLLKFWPNELFWQVEMCKPLLDIFYVLFYKLGTFVINSRICLYFFSVGQLLKPLVLFCKSMMGITLGPRRPFWEYK